MPLGGKACTCGHVYNSRGDGCVVRVDASVANHIVGGDVGDRLHVEFMSKERDEKIRTGTHTVIVWHADGREVTLRGTVDIELLEDGVGGRSARKERKSSNGPHSQNGGHKCGVGEG